jgi:hypothetical protein
VVTCAVIVDSELLLEGELLSRGSEPKGVVRDQQRVALAEEVPPLVAVLADHLLPEVPLEVLAGISLETKQRFLDGE